MNTGESKRKTLFEMVGNFHRKFGLPVAGENENTPHLVPANIVAFRKAFLREELNELETAICCDDIVEIADALVDIVYVALGTAHHYGLPFDELFDEVQRSNMLKERASSAVQSKRNSVFDVIKPDNWEPPNLYDIIMKYLR